MSQLTFRHGSNKELAEIKESLFGYTLSVVVGVRDWIPATFSTDGRELIMKVLHKSMSIILANVEKICFIGFLDENWMQFMCHLFSNSGTILLRNFGS